MPRTTMLSASSSSCSKLRGNSIGGIGGTKSWYVAKIASSTEAQILSCGMPAVRFILKMNKRTKLAANGGTPASSRTKETESQFMGTPLRFRGKEEDS